MIEDYKKLAELKKEYLAYEGSEVITWCSGCGNYGIQKAIERAVVLEGYKPKDVLFCYDIGCHGNGSDKMGKTEVYTLHGLHGRVLPVAAGAAVSNPNVKVIAAGGDGGTMSEGINHLVHTIRNDYPMIFILHNNENYGLTTGQASSTTRRGLAMNGSPDGVMMEPLNCSEFALNLGASFVARVYSGDVKHMTKVLRAALNHKGFAFVEVMQVCPTYNKATPVEWYEERSAPLKSTPKTRSDALKAARDMEKNMKLGVLYQDKKTVNFLDRLVNRKDVKSVPVDEVKRFNISELIKRFM